MRTLASWYVDVREMLQPTTGDKLDFGTSSAVKSVIAILAPALTSPLFASFQAIIEMFSGGMAS